MQIKRPAITSLIVIGVSTLILSGCSLLPNQSADVSSDTVDSAGRTETQVTLSQTATSSATGGEMVEQTQSQTVITPELIVLSAAIDGQSALDLLSDNTKVGTQSFGEAGEFVETINGLKGDAAHYWAFYVNDKYAEKGADSTILNKGDVIKFEYTTISDAPVMNQ